MGTANYLNYLLLGGLLGIIGQCLRIIVGLKKVYQEAEKLKEADTNLTTKEANAEVFDSRRIMISLLIGFVGGALAAIAIDKKEIIDKNTALGIIAAGYSGTDFIEGFISKYLKS